VIKVEQPVRGDYLRWTPPMVDGESTAHRALNRGKRSITLDLKKPLGAAVFRRLVRTADALVESFRPGVMGRFGLGYDVLARENEALVYCAITGYGQDGPYRDVVGHDINYIGYGGVLSMTGTPDGEPIIPGVQVGDMGGGGMLAAIGILAALVDRGRTGRGRFVDASMLDGVVSWLSIHAGSHLATGASPKAGTGTLNGGLACYRVYRCADGRYVTVGALEPQFWRALCDALGCAELVDDQFGPPDRQEQMAERLAEVFATRTRDEWLRMLDGVPACVGPVNDLGEALADPHVRSRGMVAEVGGRAVGPGPVPKLSGWAHPPRRPAPGFGEHTAEVLAAVGVDEAELAELRAQGAV
jgi:alpha-methylacyl-CoA racemase